MGTKSTKETQKAGEGTTPPAPPQPATTASSEANNLDKAFDKAAPVDKTEIFTLLKSHRDRYFQLINKEFPMKRIESGRETLEKFYGLEKPDQQFGSVELWTGEGDSPIDLCVVAWMGDVAKGFSNLHLTVYLKETTAAPHFGFALGTVPDIFYYVDLPPRYDVQVDIEHMAYMEPLNARALQVFADEDIKFFHSRSTHVRSTISPIGLVGVINQQVFEEKVVPHLDAYVAHFVECVKTAPAPKDPAAVKARDTLWRQTVVDNDPMNVMASRFVGEEMKDKLLAALRGDVRD